MVYFSTSLNLHSKNNENVTSVWLEWLKIRGIFGIIIKISKSKSRKRVEMIIKFYCNSRKKMNKISTFLCCDRGVEPIQAVIEFCTKSDLKI